MSAAAVALALTGCTTNILPERQVRLDEGGALDFDLPVTSLLGRRFETVVRQQYDFSCGSAALATLLRYQYGLPESEQTAFVGMFRGGDQAQIRRLGFSLLDMKRYLAARGIDADGYRVTLQQIARARTPGIALVDFEGYKHFIVLKGVDAHSLLIGDPSLGLRRMSADDFTRQWNGVYFVVNRRPGSNAPPGFNLGADADRAPAGLFYPEAEPLSLAGLALTRPLVLPAPAPVEF